MTMQRKRPWLDTRRPMKREPIKSGQFGIVEIATDDPFTKSSMIDIRVRPVFATADQLREAAHLFNQIAEVLEQQP